MKKVFKGFVTMLFSLLLLCTAGVSAFADSTVVYGADRKFSFVPDAELFDSFKSLMPGDTHTETIYVRNNFIGSKYVYIYLQAVPHSPAVPAHTAQVAEEESYASMMDFLSQLTLTVKQDGRTISLDTADKPAGLAQRQLLGVFRGRGQSVIQATIHVPITMGNEYADRVGEIDWVFIAEEWNEPINLRTGDDNAAGAWAVLLGLGAFTAVLVFVLVLTRSRKKASDSI